jgi:hypothetical protein
LRRELVHIQAAGRCEAAGATAGVAVGDLHDLEAGDRAEELARLRSDALGSGGVARVVEGDALEARVRGGRLDALVVEELHQVADLGPERAGLVGLEQVAGLLHVGAATGGVHDDRVGLGERAEVAPNSLRAVSSAPDAWSAPQHVWPFRDDDAPAVAREHPDRRSVHRAEPPILHAAGEDRPVPRASPLGSVTRGTWRPRVALGTRASVRRDRNAEPSGWTSPRLTRTQPRQRDLEAEPPHEPPLPPLRLDLDAGRLHQPAERHVRGACLLAGAAHEAEVHEGRERGAGLRSALGDGAHRGDPASRRRGLLAGHHVRRAVRQAEPARDARVETGGRRRVAGPPVRGDAELCAEEPDPIGEDGAERRCRAPRH